MFFRHLRLITWLCLLVCVSLLLTNPLWADDFVAQRVTLQQNQPKATPFPLTPRPDTSLVPTFLPVLFRDFRPHSPILGIALEGYKDEAGLQTFLNWGPVGGGAGAKLPGERSSRVRVSFTGKYWLIWRQNWYAPGAWASALCSISK